MSPPQTIHTNPGQKRKPITLPSEETLPSNERLLYFSPNDCEAATSLASIASTSSKEDSKQEMNKGDGNGSSKYIYLDNNIDNDPSFHILVTVQKLMILT